MKNLALIGLAALLLAACEPTEEEKAKLKGTLPEGCTAHDIGSYGEIDNLIIVECTGQMVTSSYSYLHQQNGKASEVDQAAVFVIGNL